MTVDRRRTGLANELNLDLTAELLREADLELVGRFRRGKIGRLLVADFIQFMLATFL